jgi:PAS domain S-box-containing protein
MKSSAGKNPPVIDQYFDAILDTIPDGIYISDRVGKTLKINRMHEKLTGLPRDELLGRNVKELRSEGVYDVVVNPEIVATRKPATSVQVSRNGRRVVLNGCPILDDQGEVALVVTFVRDVTLMAQMKDQISSQSELIEKYEHNFEYLAQEGSRRFPLISKDKSVKRVIERIARLAPTDATVLLLGETGVGKDVFAHKVHEDSPRRARPFIKVDCAAIPENLIESELFGYVAGAFSGASPRGKIGFFEMADKGTLFLDEIGELPLSMQAKLLRVLQDREIVRVGSTQPRPVDVRILAATNLDLEQAVGQGAFRADLFYRLRVGVLAIPPLRDRPLDIVPLAQHFLARFAGRYRKKATLSEQVAEALKAYHWPGNVRELENMIQSLVITCDRETIELQDLPGPLLDRQKPDVLAASLSCHAVNVEQRPLWEIMSEIERGLIRDALVYHGSVSKVAKLFQVNRTTIFRKLQEEGGAVEILANARRAARKKQPAPPAPRRRRKA